jgi:hypothetical protein
MGRNKVTVSKNLNLAPALGNGDGGGEMPSFLFRRRMRVFLWVSRGATRNMNAKTVKNIVVH